MEKEIAHRLGSNGTYLINIENDISMISVIPRSSWSSRHDTTGSMRSAWRGGGRGGGRWRLVKKNGGGGGAEGGGGGG